MLAAQVIFFRPLHRHGRRSLALMAVLAALALTPCAAFQHSGMPRTLRHESHHEIFHLEEAWRNAVLKADIPTLDGLLSEDYTAITADGALQSKEQALDSLRSGTTHFTALAVFDRKVRFYGTTALVTCKAVVSGVHAGVNISGSYRYTRVYVRNAQGDWKIVSFEVNRIRTPGEGR